MPSAQSSPIEPEGTASTSTRALLPSVMIASSPNFVFIARIAASIAAVSLPSREPTVFAGTSFFPFLNTMIFYTVGNYVKSNRFARAAAKPVYRRHGDHSIPCRRGEAVHKFTGLVGIRRGVIYGQKRDVLSSPHDCHRRGRGRRTVGWGLNCNLRTLQELARLKQPVR